jgi:small subunit ribosomal protein S24e
MLDQALAAVELVTLNDRDNSLLERHELTVLFKNAAGRIKKSEAAALVTKQHNTSKAVIPISMTCFKGKNDILGTFYVFSDEKTAKSYLPRYMFLRTMPKDERKKILAEEKAAKLKAKQALAGQARGQTRGKR